MGSRLKGLLVSTQCALNIGDATNGRNIVTSTGNEIKIFAIVDPSPSN